MKAPPPRTRSDTEALKLGSYFDPRPVERAIQFLTTFCKQSIGKWEGRPLVLMPWQQELLMHLYGMRNKEGSRRYRTASCWLPKNSGKSTFAAALSLMALVADKEPGAQVVHLASTREQAGICYRQACDMVAQHPALDSVLWTRKNIKAIEYEQRRSTLKVMSGDRGTGHHGFSISFLLVDEVAEIASREMYEAMRHNAMKRDGSLMVTISTAGNSKDTVGGECFEYAERVLHGDIIDTTLLPIIYQAPQEAPWDELETFVRCNPGYGVTIDRTTAETLLQEAKNDPRKEAAYRTLRLNQWVGASTQWLSSTAWDACGGHVDWEQFAGAPCYVGLDLALRGDLAAYVLLFEREGLFYLKARSFMPEQNAVRKEQQDAVPYRAWAKSGSLTLTPGDVIDYREIRSALQADAERYNLVEVGYDPYNASHLVQQLQDEDRLTCVEIRQTLPHLAPATSYFERLVKDKKLRHGDDPVLRWQAGNAVVRADANDNICVHKARSTSRIDALAASIMALSRQMVAASEIGNYAIW
jgi:phage terminase large subunit-like protein